MPLDVVALLVKYAIGFVIAAVVIEVLIRAGTRLLRSYGADLTGVRRLAYAAIVVFVLMPLAGEVYPNPSLLYYSRIAQVLAIGYLGYRIFNRIVASLSAGMIRMVGNKLFTGVFVPFRKLGNATILILIFIAAVNASGVNLSPLLFGWGFALFIFALAVQGILGDVVAGLYILLTRPFGIGDLIQFPDGQVCEILDIKDQRTVLKDVVTREVSNYSNLDLLKVRLVRLEGRTGHLVVPVPVKATGSGDIEKARNILSELAAKAPNTSPDPAPGVYLMETSEPRVKFDVALSLADMGRKRETVDWFNTNLVQRFGAEGLQLAPP